MFFEVISVTFVQLSNTSFQNALLIFYSKLRWNLFLSHINQLLFFISASNKLIQFVFCFRSLLIQLDFNAYVNSINVYHLQNIFDEEDLICLKWLVKNFPRNKKFKDSFGNFGKGVLKTRAHLHVGILWCYLWNKLTSWSNIKLNI